MKIKDFVQLYTNDAMVQTIAESLKSDTKNIKLTGLHASANSLIPAALQTLMPNYVQLLVVHDKDEANIYMNDLQTFAPHSEILLFPTSYKKIYQFEETDNANILQRAEVLNRLNDNNKSSKIIVTYPDALGEKVINKRSLVANTFGAKVGEILDSNFISEMLIEYDFEKTDFVFEPGQFAIRGGIIDIFSYAHDLPYRIELFGNEIESIRTFNPDTQLSVEHKQYISIIPNVQTKLLQETRESILHFFPKETIIWLKDVKLTLETIDNLFDRANHEFQKALQETYNSKLITNSADLFETAKEFEKGIKEYPIVEFGTKAHYKKNLEIKFDIKSQESFNKDTKLMASTLSEYQHKGYSNIIFGDSLHQYEKLATVFHEADTTIKTQHIDHAIHNGFIDHQLKLVCYTDHQLFDRYHKVKVKEKFSKSKALTLKELKTLQVGDYVTHTDYGIARFVGLDKVDSNGKQQEVIRLLFRDDDLLCLSIHSLHKISKYSGKEGGPPNMSKLGSPDWENKKSKARKNVKDIAKELITLYAKRKAAPGFAFSKDGFLQAELETSFIYEDTPDQAKATEDVKNDMEKPHPMDRLVCGDVGFGKTEVAIRAAFKAVCDSKQVAVLVPTTVLAMQHFKTFAERMAKLPVNIEYVNRFKTAGQIKDTLKRVAEGKTDIIIGTHRVVSKDVKFKNLGLLIIDEEQKFGVSVKEKLKEIKVNVDTLTLTATPIPRTLHFSLMGARDLSIIATPPPNRQPVTTEIHTISDEIIRDAVSAELKRGGQVFFVHNRVAELDSMANKIFKLVPEARVATAHGQLEGEQLEKIMLGFIDGDYDVLVSTNIIESGLDIPNANTIIINHAHMFGLSDLHQMRGRVGRSNKKAYCYLLSNATGSLTSDARKRLGTLEEFSELGDGFKVAMRDLDIRGAGNLLGGEQSGFITDLGFEMYHQILNEAIQELKETEFKELFEHELNVKQFLPDCSIETDLALLIPETYVSNISERLGLYSELDSIKDEKTLVQFVKNLEDKFGRQPREVRDLIKAVRLRWQAEILGLEKLTLKGGLMKGQFVPQTHQTFFQSDAFGAVLTHVQKNAKTCLMKELKGKLLIQFENIKTIDDALRVLTGIYATEVKVEEETEA